MVFGEGILSLLGVELNAVDLYLFHQKTIYKMVVFGAQKNIVFIKNRAFGDLLSINILYLAN